MRYALAGLFQVIGIVFCWAGDSPAADWRIPECGVVRGGTGGVTYSRDGGASITRTGTALAGTTYTYSISTTGLPNVLLAVKDTTLLISRDAGCTWGAAGASRSDFGRIAAAASGGTAYVWADNRRYLAEVRIASESVLVGDRSLPGTDQSVVGFAVDRDNGAHVRACLQDGTIWDSTDGGRTWTSRGVPPMAGVYVYRASFNPVDLDHTVLGLMSEGAYTSFDGGLRWEAATGLATPVGGANAFEVLISPAAGRRVWCEGIDLADGTRFIALSTDRGLSFKRVLLESQDVTLANGTPMWAHPRQSNLLYFSFGTGWRDYGVDLYRFNVRTLRLRKAHFAQHRIFGLEFNPADPQVIYIALSQEIIE